jgi:hypothetical protein
MSVVKHDRWSCAFSATAAIAVWAAHRRRWRRRGAIGQNHSQQAFGVPSHGVLELIETSDKVARLSEAGYGYETRVRELEHQFESKAAELREEYLSIVLQIHESPER